MLEHLLIERHEHRAVRLQALGDREAQLARHERRRQLAIQIVVLVALLEAHLEHVAKAGRGDEGGARALALDQRIGREGRAVEQHLDLARRNARFSEQRGDAVEHRALGRLVRGEELPRPAVAAALQDDVSEGTADVGGKANGRHGRVCYRAMGSLSRAECESLDTRDPLGHIADEFPPGEPGWLYFDANSIGAMPIGAHRAMSRITDEWRRLRRRGWSDADWLDA